MGGIGMSTNGGRSGFVISIGMGGWYVLPVGVERVSARMGAEGEDEDE